MAKLIQKFHINNGDILALKANTANSNTVDIDKIVHAFERLKINAIVMVVESFDDLKVLNETEMNKRGWFRMQQLAKFIRTGDEK